MNAEDVANYLRENPSFFENYADFLSQIRGPHPLGGQAIPLSEWQVQALREKNKVIETKLAELIQFSEENDVISDKVHRLTLALLKLDGVESLIAAVHLNLREDFAVPHSALRTWGKGPALDLPEFAPVSDDLKAYAAGLAQPYCGPNENAECAGWFGEAGAQIRSVALMPLLADGACFGLLALGSEDVRRFYPEMGTLYLRRLGEMVSAALARML